VRLSASPPLPPSYYSTEPDSTRAIAATESAPPPSFSTASEISRRHGSGDAAVRGGRGASRESEAGTDSSSGGPRAGRTVPPQPPPRTAKIRSAPAWPLPQAGPRDPPLAAVLHPHAHTPRTRTDAYLMRSSAVPRLPAHRRSGSLDRIGQATRRARAPPLSHGDVPCLRHADSSRLTFGSDGSTGRRVSTNGGGSGHATVPRLSAQQQEQLQQQHGRQRYQHQVQ
jgi:hypothetical protein